MPAHYFSRGKGVGRGETGTIVIGNGATLATDSLSVTGTVTDIGTLSVESTASVETNNLSVTGTGLASGIISVGVSATLGDETIACEAGDPGFMLEGTNLGDKTIARSVSIPDDAVAPTITITGVTVDLGETDADLFAIDKQRQRVAIGDADDASIEEPGFGVRGRRGPRPRRAT